MLHIKFRENRPAGSGEEGFLRVFTIYGRGGHLAGMRTGIFQKEEILSKKRKPPLPPRKCIRFQHVGSNLTQYISANFSQKRGNPLKRGRFSFLNSWSCDPGPANKLSFP